LADSSVGAADQASPPRDVEAELARRVEGIVPMATIEALQTA
jgi:hypothetical protein